MRRSRGWWKGSGTPVGVVDDTKVVEELSGGWTGWLEVPGFVKNRMVACLHDTTIEIDVADVLVGGGISEENSAEVVAVEFSTSLSRATDAYPRTK